MRKLNSYENSRAQFARAAKVIPSGIYGHREIQRNARSENFRNRKFRERKIA